MFLQVSVCPRERCPLQGWGMPGGGGGHVLWGRHAWHDGVCMAGVCAWWGACGTHAPLADIMRYGQWAGGTHPTGMHSCFMYHFTFDLDHLDHSIEHDFIRIWTDWPPTGSKFCFWFNSHINSPLGASLIFAETFKDTLMLILYNNLRNVRFVFFMKTSTDSCKVVVLVYHWLPLATIDLVGENREFEVWGILWASCSCKCRTLT